MSCDGVDENHDEFTPGIILLDNRYEMGEVRNTKTITFEFANQGDADLIGINFVSSNPAFVISPDYIPRLRPRSQQSLTQNIEITAVHGMDPSGIGFLDLMPAGLNMADLEVSAKTTDFYGDTLDVRAQASISAIARIVDIEISNAFGVIPLDSSEYTVSSGPVSPWAMRAYRIPNGDLTLTNTGNIDLSIRVFRRINDVQAIYRETDAMIPVGRDTTIARFNAEMAFKINGNNTISNPDVLPIQSDGFIYLYYF